MSDSEYFSPAMVRYCGKVAKIVEVYGARRKCKRYRLDIDSGYWQWSGFFFDFLELYEEV